MGYPTAQYNLGRAYDLGEGVPENPGEAFGWYMKAAENGNIPAMEKLAEVYFFGQLGQQKDAELGRKWQKQADKTRKQLGLPKPSIASRGISQMLED